MEARAMADFCRQYGITFRDPGLLKLALTHRSYLHVTGQGPRESNERLEFLGDSVLGLTTSDFLYRSHPSEHEGQLTKTKSLLVSKAILSRRALAMGLGRFVLMSHSEMESGGRLRLSILADAFESVIGAIYLDQGFPAAQAFIERWLLRESRVIVADKQHTNYKSHLQEYVQSTFRTHPVYRIRSEMGPDHSKQFMVEVMVGRRQLGVGRGPNKKEAEQAAARNALEAVEAGPLSDRETRRVEREPRDSGPEEAGGAGEAPAVEPDEEASEHGRGRRRRGRRGGRGRREGWETPAAGAAPGTPPPAAPPRGEAGAGEAPGRTDDRSTRRDRPERSERAERSERTERPERGERATRGPGRFEGARPAPPPSPAPRPPELEPRPSAHEEDENEEVGRPEGPQEEWHVDPFALKPPAALEPPRAIPAMPIPPAVSAPPRASVMPPEAPPLRPMVEEADDEAEEAAHEPPSPATDEPATAEGRSGEADEEDLGPRYPETGPAPPPPPPPSWGRRGRRGH